MARPETEPTTDLAQRLREARLALGFKERKRFAEHLGLPESTMRNYESGLREPPVSVLIIYKDKCDISLEWLLTGEGKMFGKASDNLHIAGGLLDKQRLEDAISAVYEGLGTHRLPPDTMAKIIISAYDILSESDDNKRSRDNIIRLVRAA